MPLNGFSPPCKLFQKLPAITGELTSEVQEVTVGQGHRLLLQPPEYKQGRRFGLDSALRSEPLE